MLKKERERERERDHTGLKFAAPGYICDVITTDVVEF
jgi:hypothetical protein